jgi:lipoate-protein ligase A
LQNIPKFQVNLPNLFAVLCYVFKIVPEMLCISLKNQDPYFCLAAEEYLMKNFSEDVFMLWQSINTVVVGKHQNAMAEINYPFVHTNNVQVARRISGGGTVFHDKGNVNFAFIKTVDSPSEISFKRFVQPVIDALGKLGVKAITSGRNDLLVEGRKISGNAEHIFKNRVLHHGTLLFNSDLRVLNQSTKAVAGKYQGKAVQSNRSEVTNILPFLKSKMTIEDFISFLLNDQLGKPGNTAYQFSEEDNAVVRELVTEKFSTWDWNFGYSPKYTFIKESKLNGKNLNVNLLVDRGYITDAEITGDYFSGAQSYGLKRALTGVRHFYDAMKDKLLETCPEVTDELVFSFF